MRLESGVRQCGWSGVRVCGGLSGVLGLTGAGAGERWRSGATGGLRGDSSDGAKDELSYFCGRNLKGKPARGEPTCWRVWES